MHTIARIVRAAAHAATYRRPQDGSAASAALPPSDLEPRNPGYRSPAITLPRRSGLGATLGAVAVVFATLGLPAAFVAATATPHVVAARPLRGAASPASQATAAATPSAPGCDCET